MMMMYYHESKHCKLYLGDSLAVLKEGRIPDESVDLVFTSPPYWMQRNYDISGQLGMESDYKDYLAKLLQIFAEVKRVLKPTGSCWVVLDDTYNTSKHGGITSGQTEHGSTIKQKAGFLETQHKTEFYKLRQTGIPESSMMMIPERFAIGMVDKLGWCLRNYVAWVKPNAMPESAKSRLTTSWERVFWFTKRSSGGGYYYDTRYEPFATDQGDLERQGSSQFQLFGGINKHEGYRNRVYSGKVWKPKVELGRIMRDVWIITTKGYEGQHYATYPEKLCETPIEACCPVNGQVLDPFMGSGTTGIVALKLARNFIGIDISSEYLELAKKRLDPYLTQERLGL